jgi:hypothetical protein
VLTVSLDGPNLRLTASKGRKLLAWLALQVNPAWVSDDLVSNPQDLSTVLRNAVKRLGYMPSRVLAVYPGVRSVTRLLAIPAAGEIRPEAILAREARRTMGVNPDQSYLFFTPAGGDQVARRYFVLSVPRQRLDSFWQALLLAGLRPSVVELKALALARAIVGPLGVSSCVVVNLEPSVLSILIIHERIPYTVNNIPLEEQGALAEDTLRGLLLDNLQRSLEFHQLRNPTAPLPSPGPLFLCGAHPTREDPSLVPTLEQNLPLKAQGLSTPPRFVCPPDFPLATLLANVGVLLRVIG